MELKEASGSVKKHVWQIFQETTAELVSVVLLKAADWSCQVRNGPFITFCKALLFFWVGPKAVFFFTQHKDIPSSKQALECGPVIVRGMVLVTLMGTRWRPPSCGEQMWKIWHKKMGNWNHSSCSLLWWIFSEWCKLKYNLRYRIVISLYVAIKFNLKLRGGRDNKK